jgi:4-carboxymuconolactone decarboxylase
VNDGEANGSHEPGARRARGLAKMAEVYGWEVGDGPGDFFGMTVDHLFGEVWTRPGLSQKERRLLLIGICIGSGLDDVTGLQLDAALRLEELTAEELRDVVIFATHYAGWPKGAKLNSEVESLIAKAERAREA